MSGTAHREAQEQLLVHGPNFAVTPKCPPIGEYSATVEQVCQHLTRVSIVVMERDEHIRKAEELLNQPTYKSIHTHPTS